MRMPAPEKLVVLSAWASRLTTASLMIYSLRVLSTGMTAAEYATFVIIVGLSGWFTLFGDPGIGHATQNSVTRKTALGEDPAGDILTAYGLLAAATAGVALVTLALAGYVSPLLFSKLNAGDTTPLATTLWWSGLIFTAGAAAGASSKILYAVHKGYVANIVTATASVIGFAILNAGLPMAQSKVLFAIAALYAPPLALALLLAAGQIWRARHQRSAVNRKDTMSLLRAARWFLFFNVIAGAVLQVDYIIMSQKISPLEIVQYYNIAKLFAFSAFFNQAIMFAIWPRFTEQFATGRSAEISGALDKLMLYGVAITVVTTTGVMLAAGPLSQLLSPGVEVEFRYTVIAAFGALALVRCITDPYAIFLQSIGRIRPLVAFAAVQAVIGGSLQWVLSDMFGIEGILIALVLSFLLTVAWGLPLTARRSLSQAPAA